LSLTYPILYSFRRCPYAMRARMALLYANVNVLLREVDLRNKPTQMLEASAKATVPVLVLDDEVIDESLDIIKWALAISDPDGWLSGLTEQQLVLARTLINENDGEFKKHLDHYKYADRYPDQTMQVARDKAEVFIEKLDTYLQHSRYLVSDKLSFVDIAIFPFVRQFSYVDKVWFDESNYVHLQKWLQELLDCEYFNRIMKKVDVWERGSDEVWLAD